MSLPFSIEEFLSVFERYNTAVWPMQIVLHALAAGIIVILVLKMRKGSQVINAILSFFWLWMGIVYQIIYFSSINPAAYIFGAAFTLQALLFAYFGFLRKQIEYHPNKSVRSIVGIILVIYGVALYPMTSYLFGFDFRQSPTFGLPCPTTIFTLGFLLMTQNKIQTRIIIIPLLWSLIGFSAAVNLSIKQDFALGVAGLTSLILFFFERIPNPVKAS